MAYSDFRYEVRMAWRRSPALWSIVAVNVIVGWLAWAVSVFPGHHVQPVSWLGVPASASAFASRPWTLLTYMFTQTSLLHLLFNMLWLFWFGQVLAERAGQRGVWRAYLTGGVAGGLLFLVSTLLFPSLGHACLTGASASVVAVMVEAALRSPDREFRLFLFGTVKLKWLALVSLALLLLGLGGGNSGGQAAHLGGALAGLGLYMSGKIRRRTPRAPRRSARRTAKAMESAMTDMQRLDALLDKIKLSGYDSLTAKEKEELRRLSDR